MTETKWPSDAVQMHIAAVRWCRDKGCTCPLPEVRVKPGENLGYAIMAHHDDCSIWEHCESPDD
jgi:hypothetical protein